MSLIDLKGLAQQILYPRWRGTRHLAQGYALLLPTPMDMPFLLRLSLEGLKKIDTSNCGQILVIGDGWSDDGGSALREVISQFDDPRIELILFSKLDTKIIRGMRDSHWLTIIYGVNHARHQYAFLHDADAFFLESNSIARTYDYCFSGEKHAIGVTARWDPFFERIGYQIPGTWQMMLSVPWLRGHRPYHVRGRLHGTPHGPHVFDTLLYPEYLDYEAGKVGVMSEAPKYVHFNCTIATYRDWRRAGQQQVSDDLFRLLLLSLLEAIAPSASSRRLMPAAADLARGLCDKDYPVRYDTEDAAENYPQFRAQVRELCETSIMSGDRVEMINGALAPFDAHFEADVKKFDAGLSVPARKFRWSGLGGGVITEPI